MEYFDIIKKAVLDAKNKVAEGYDFTKSKVGDLATEAKQRVELGYDYSKQKANEGYEYAKQKAAEAKQKAEDGYDYAKQKANDGYDYAKQKANDGYDYAKQKAGEGVDYAKEKAGEGVDYAKEKAADAYEGASDWIGKKLSNMAESQSNELKAGQALRTPAEKQHGYDVARQSMLGEFSSDPISACQECIASAKAQRRKERLELVNGALESCPGQKEATLRLRRDMDEVENMRCAKHVYLANDKDAPADLRDNPPPGFTKATDEQLKEMGLDQDMLTPPDSEFRAAVYMKDEAVWGKDPHPAAVIAFRGSTPEKEDWDNNMAQGVNREAPYYRRAVEIGNALAANDADVRIVGHSLGGGLASAAQGGSGLNASTYNAAGLHSKTVERYSKDEHKHAEPGKIDAYRIKGEILTKTQESLWGSKGKSAVLQKAVGTKHDLEPAHDEDYFEKSDKIKANDKDTYDGYLHGMDQVIAATEAQKTADESALKKCQGK